MMMLRAPFPFFTDEAQLAIDFKRLAWNLATGKSGNSVPFKNVHICCNRELIQVRGSNVFCLSLRRFKKHSL